MSGGLAEQHVGSGVCGFLSAVEALSDGQGPGTAPCLGVLLLVLGRRVLGRRACQDRARNRLAPSPVATRSIRSRTYSPMDPLRRSAGVAASVSLGLRRFAVSGMKWGSACSAIARASKGFGPINRREDHPLGTDAPAPRSPRMTFRRTLCAQCRSQPVPPSRIA